MKKERIPPDDNTRIRCPRLGQQIAFSYCRIENGGLPCFKTLDCWYAHFLVEDFLHEVLTDEEWERAFERPSRPKIATLVELIQQAKDRKKGDA